MILEGRCPAPVEIDADNPMVGTRECGGNLKSIHNFKNCKTFICQECGAEIHFDNKHRPHIAGYHTMDTMGGC